MHKPNSGYVYSWTDVFLGFYETRKYNNSEISGLFEKSLKIN